VPLCRRRQRGCVPAVQYAFGRVRPPPFGSVDVSWRCQTDGCSSGRGSRTNWVYRSSQAPMA
jgi:hypothetical protein